MNRIELNTSKLIVPMFWGIILMASACKSNEYLLMEPVKGKVIASSDKAPVTQAKIYINKSAFNAFDTILTKKDGSFFIDKVTLDDDKDLHLQKDISYLLSIEKKGYKTVNVNASKFRKALTRKIKDTIDLGFIYMDLAIPAPINDTNSRGETFWTGQYTCNFLRLKEESGDPRAWGMIYLDIDRKGARFRLDTYEENIKKDLIIEHVNPKEIQLAATDDKNLRLRIQLDKNKYRLSGRLMEEIVGIKDTYELDRK